jgi:hypothetical protein
LSIGILAAATKCPAVMGIGCGGTMAVNASAVGGRQFVAVFVTNGVLPLK